MAIGAGAGRGTGLVVPEGFAFRHPEHARVGRVVPLHRLRVAAHVLEARSPLGGRNLGLRQARQAQRNRACDDERDPVHSTEIFAVSTWLRPWSSNQRKAITPLSVATVVNAR